MISIVFEGLKYKCIFGSLRKLSCTRPCYEYLRYSVLSIHCTLGSTSRLHVLQSNLWSQTSQKQLHSTERERVPRKTLLDAPTSNVLYNTVSKSSPCTPRAHLEALRSRQDTGQALEVPETERPWPPATGAVTHGPRLSVCLRESPRGRRVRGACPPVSVDVWSQRLWASYPQQTRPACEKRWTCMGTSHVNAQAPLQGASRFGALSGDSNPGGGE